MEMDWVKRKAIGEQFVENQHDEIWRALCTALGSAVQSYSLYYGGTAHGHSAGDRHYRISVHSKAPYQDAVIDVTFAPPEVKVVSKMGHCKMSTFVLNPSKEAPFRSDKQQFTVDQLSEAILHCTFFPAERRGVATHTVVPCSESTA